MMPRDARSGPATSSGFISKARLAASGATWQVLGQQVLMGRMNIPASVAQSPDPVTMTAYITRRLWQMVPTLLGVVLVLPAVFLDYSRSLYLLVAEIFAPAAECTVSRLRLPLPD